MYHFIREKSMLLTWDVLLLTWDVSIYHFPLKYGLVQYFCIVLVIRGAMMLNESKYVRENKMLNRLTLCFTVKKKVLISKK